MSEEIDHRLVFNSKRDVFDRDLLMGATQTALDVLRRDAVKHAERGPCLACVGTRFKSHGSVGGDSPIPCDVCDGQGVTDKRFQLNSGRYASYYVDVSEVSLRQPGFAALAVLVGNAALRSRCYVVGGPLVGAAPLATAAMVGFSQARQVVQNSVGLPTWAADSLRSSTAAFYLRDGIKDHGAGGRIVGHIPPNSRVMLVDDVVSTGESVVGAYSYLHNQGIDVVKVFALVDRGKGAGQRIVDLGVEYEYVFTMADLGVEEPVLPPSAEEPDSSLRITSEADFKRRYGPLALGGRDDET